jgi:hypothetical protein
VVVTARRLGGIAMIALALLLAVGPVLTFVKVMQVHAVGIGPRAVDGIAYLLPTAGFCLLVGLYLFTGRTGKGK